MGFFKKLFGSQGAQANLDVYAFTVTCNRCGELIEGRVNLNNDLSADYEDGGGYHVRKVLMGSEHCFQQIEVELKFNAARNLIQKSAKGGKFTE
jgi:hypothetical protein